MHYRNPNHPAGALHQQASGFMRGSEPKFTKFTKFAASAEQIGTLPPPDARPMRVARARRYKKRKLDAAAAKAMRQLAANGVAKVEIAREFKVDRQTVWRVLSGQVWA